MCPHLSNERGYSSTEERGLTLVLEKIAHSRAAREDQLRHILNDFRFFLGRESSEPFGKSLKKRFEVRIGLWWATRMGGAVVPLSLALTAI